MPDLYLLHFEPAYRHARHYLGYATGTGRGRQYAKLQAEGLALGAHELVQAAQWDGVVIHVADVLVGEGRTTQRRLRDSHNLARHCPICTAAAESSPEAT